MTYSEVLLIRPPLGPTKSNLNIESFLKARSSYNETRCLGPKTGSLNIGTILIFSGRNIKWSI